MKNKVFYLVAAIAFIIASIFAFITHFTENKTSNTWVILGFAFVVLSFPMIVSFVKANKE